MNEISERNGNSLAGPVKQMITPTRVEMAAQMGEIAWKSGICKAPNKEAAVIVMLKGWELGFSMTSSFDYIQVIQGKVGVSPLGALALIRAHPEIVKSCTFEEIRDDKGEFSGMKCIIVRREADTEREYSASFTMADAAQAQLTNATRPNPDGKTRESGGYEKYPRNMCQWRALGFAADLAVPDLLGGMTGLIKQPELLDDETVTYPTSEHVVVVEAPKAIDFAKLTETFSPDEILRANGGKMPANDEECAKIFDKLSCGGA